MEKQAGLFLLICSLFFVATLAHRQNHIWETNGYWQMRAEVAMERTQAAYNPFPFNVTNHLNHQARKLLETTEELNTTTRRILPQRYKGGCEITNPIDACWRCRPNWSRNRKRLAKCAMGFAKGTTGGIKGRKYVVTDASDNDMVNPKPGTLRHAVIQEEPLWIIFAAHMTIRLNQELIMTSNKTIDARGANVVIEGGAGITLQFVENVIIHGLKFRNIVPGSGGMIRDSASHYGFRTQSDGDAISIYGSHHIWIDHVSLSKASDGLIDVIEGSTAITISNCHMTQHDKVFLFGVAASRTIDRIMQITVAYTHFGHGLVQRMPRCRYGFFHLVNNDYTHWLMYAIGGSQNPTIISQGNRFIAPPNVRAKEITHREQPQSQWDSGTWRSENDLLLNGATFTQSGKPIPSNLHGRGMIAAVPGTEVGHLTRFAGPLKCIPKRPC